MTETLQHDLTSALYRLHQRFHDEPESLHFAVAVVFSSIFKKYGLPCIIVGGQSAVYWMRLPGSTDVDYVSSASRNIAGAIEQCGFKRSPDCHFRYIHPETEVLIELVGETIKIADMEAAETVEINISDIDDPLVQSLMPGPAEVLDPTMVFF